MSDPETTPNLLIVEDDESVQNLLRLAAQSRGWRPVAAGSGHEACLFIDADIKAVLLDHGLPDGDGIGVLVRLREKYPAVPVIMLTGVNDAETAVRALRAGADDYLTKPFELERLFRVIQDACRVRRQNPQVQSGDESVMYNMRLEFQQQSHSPRMHALFHQMQKAAQLNLTVLLTGESGTGKTLIAREIHRLGPRADESFIPVSCPALPRELLESELFGHERGAFTGATTLRTGRFEQASKGTIFLDEIGDLPSELQPKLLTVLQDQQFFRVGGNRMLHTDARIIAATNIDLLARAREGLFREDLYYRLNVLELHLPPLRERIVDIPDLTRSILNRIASKRANEPWHITPSALRTLANHPWPGNIRQLENVLERATVFAEGTELGNSDIAPLLEGSSTTPSPRIVLNQSLRDVERATFFDAYELSGHNKALTARKLGVATRTVYNMLTKYGIK